MILCTKAIQMHFVTFTNKASPKNARTFEFDRTEAYITLTNVSLEYTIKSHSGIPKPTHFSEKSCFSPTPLIYNGKKSALSKKTLNFPRSSLQISKKFLNIQIFLLNPVHRYQDKQKDIYCQMLRCEWVDVSPVHMPNIWERIRRLGYTSNQTNKHWIINWISEILV